MKNKIRFSALLVVAALGGCDWIDSLGRHLPVLNEEDRCENWQCFTESGRSISDSRKRALAARNAEEKEQEAREKAKERGEIPASPRTPINGANAPAVQAVPAGEVKAKDITPYDMTPDQLQGISTPSE